MDKKFLEVSQIKLRGIKEVYGMKFHEIEGGFGKSKKSMLAKEIANIHGRELKKVNELINNNKIRFKENIDIVDLKGTEFEVVLKDYEIYSQNSINRSENIYLLSERGYSKLLKIMDDDLAWDKYDELVDGYFNMKETINNQIPKMSKELEAILMMDSKQQKMDERITKLENNSTIDYSQQEELRILGTKKVVAILGGADAPAYKELNKKVFSSFWRDYKRKLNVNSYKNTLVKDFEIGRQAIINWKPNKEIKFMIDGCNAQIRM